MFRQNISTDDSIYYNHFKKSPGKGGTVGRGSVFPRVRSVNGYVVRGRILMNLRATISEGNEKIHFLHKLDLK